MVGVIVLGLGGMGSAAAAHLAAPGARVVGVEQFTPAHGRVEPRRLAGHPAGVLRGPGYVPLLLRAYELWADLEATTPAS